MSTPTAEPIRVWRYYEAPKVLQISNFGGDEDYLAEIPPCYADNYIPWLETGSFACCEVDTFPHPEKEGWKIAIGCHA